MGAVASGRRDGRPRPARHPAAGDLRLHAQAEAARPAAGQRAAFRGAAVPAARPRRALLRRHLVGRLRHRGNADRDGPGGRPGGVHADPADDAGRAGRHRAGRALLPRGRLGLHPGRRLLRRGQGELRAAGRPGRGGGAAHRLHGDRRGADRRGQRRHRLRVPAAGEHPGDRPAHPGLHLRDRRADHVLRQPARHPRGGPGVRAADLPVLRLRRGDDRRRPVPRGDHRPGARGQVPGPHLPVRAQHREPDQHRDDLHAGEGLRQRRIVADRHRGGLQRGRRAPPAGGPQRAADPRHAGLDRRVPDRGHLLAGARHPRHPLRGRLPDGAGAGGQRRLRQRRALHVLRGAGGDRADPVHRR